LGVRGKADIAPHEVKGVAPCQQSVSKALASLDRRIEQISPTFGTAPN
jgi:hypothetical protein